ncbi:uncharacterized protein PFL1_05235 [Pseudozyma flocculosa PF-1]|uniref:Uncharacterized protein n=2 Tax=Pseudozyma flocculosa TaxID=84751 RepID=A0A5C3F5A4_9BASI|nr:uncharacterized protein PFL1_05235 [Pseudozyma flocculosa PF-1]EPQ27313.1 hypothetical protein PFL1_05235 [Pseudozyma flocculosa PF-1]SPO39684.1 uncharacterized protein PSFLO_05165 [Pseudozyma flocculosa]
MASDAAFDPDLLSIEVEAIMSPRSESSADSGWTTDDDGDGDGDESPCVDEVAKRIYCVICGGSSSDACLAADESNVDDIAWMSEWRALIKTHESLNFDATSKGRTLQSRQLSEAYRTIAVGYSRWVVNTLYRLQPDTPLIRAVHASCYDIVAGCINGCSIMLRLASVDTLAQIYDLAPEDVSSDADAVQGRLGCCEMRWSDDWTPQDIDRRHYAGDPQFISLQTALALVDDESYCAKDRLPSRNGMAVSRDDLTLRLPPEIIERISEFIMDDSWAHHYITRKRKPAATTRASRQAGGSRGTAARSRTTTATTATEAAARRARRAAAQTQVQAQGSSAGGAQGRRSTADGNASASRPRSARPSGTSERGAIGPNRGETEQEPAAGATASTGASRSRTSYSPASGDRGQVAEGDRTLLAWMATCKRLYFFSYPARVWRYLVISRESKLSFVWPPAPSRWKFEGYADDELEYVSRSCGHGLYLQVKQPATTSTAAPTAASGTVSAAQPAAGQATATQGQTQAQAQAQTQTPSATFEIHTANDLGGASCRCAECEEELAKAIPKEEALAKVSPEKVYRGLSKLHGLQNRERICNAVYRRDADLADQYWQRFLSDGVLGPVGLPRIDEWLATGGLAQLVAQRASQQEQQQQQQQQPPEQQARPQRPEQQRGRQPGQGQQQPANRQPDDEEVGSAPPCQVQ